MIECCSRAYNIQHTNSRSVLKYQHQWELEQKGTDDSKRPKVFNNGLTKTTENIVLHLKVFRGVRGVLLAYVVWHHIKVPHFLIESDKYLNFDKEIITRAPIVNEMSNTKFSEARLDKLYYLYNVYTFKLDNALVYQILSKIFMDTDAYVYMKQRKSLQDVEAVYLDVQKLFLGLAHVAR